MVRKTIILYISLFFLIGCSGKGSKKFAMDVYIENNTSSVINSINIKYSGDEINIESINPNEIAQEIAYIGVDTAFDIKFNIKGEEIEVKNVGYYYFGGKDKVQIILNKDELFEKISNSSDLISYRY